MIQLQDITFRYTDQTSLFQEFTWNVPFGETWSVLGPSGCGKSTLLYLIAGIQFPINGRLSINGNPILRPRPETGFIIQEYGLLPWATVRQNTELGQRVREFYGPDGKHTPDNFQIGTSADTWLKRLNILELADKYPSQISGGQRQRTAIARTLAMKPDLLLMDEPFSSLDAPTRERMQNLILEIQAEQNLTLITVTHMIEEAAFLGKKILMLNHPPNLSPNVIENPRAGSPSYRGSNNFFELCQELRERME